MEQTFELQVNGKLHTVTVRPETPLLYVVRNELGYLAAKYGCGRGQCGACTVLKEGISTRSCLLPVQSVGTAAITTLEGVSPGNHQFHKVQQAFIAEQAAQCGYCTNGMILTAIALLEKDKQPSETTIRSAMNGILCRCGVYDRVVIAIQKAAQLV